MSPDDPWSRSAMIRLDGNRCATPKPAMPMDAPSPTSATATAGEATSCPCLTYPPTSLLPAVADGKAIRPGKASIVPSDMPGRRWFVC